MIADYHARGSLKVEPDWLLYICRIRGPAGDQRTCRTGTRVNFRVSAFKTSAPRRKVLRMQYFSFSPTKGVTLPSQGELFDETDALETRRSIPTHAFLRTIDIMRIVPRWQVPLKEHQADSTSFEQSVLCQRTSDRPSSSLLSLRSRKRDGIISLHGRRCQLFDARTAVRRSYAIC